MDQPQGPRRGYLFLGAAMPIEPTQKRAIAFFDGQNLYNAAKAAFGNPFPDYDPMALASWVCAQKGWDLIGVRHYTGIHLATEKPFWNHYWTAKMGAMGTRGIHTFSRPLKYRTQELKWPDGSFIKLPDGSPYTIRMGQEKGIDIRIALDIVSLAVDQSYDVAILFSQDQDLSEAVDEVKTIARLQNRWVKVACAYPFSLTPVNPRHRNGRGVDRTDWIKIDQAAYSSCHDPNDYCPKKPGNPPLATS